MGLAPPLGVATWAFTPVSAQAPGITSPVEVEDGQVVGELTPYGFGSVDVVGETLEEVGDGEAIGEWVNGGEGAVYKPVRGCALRRKIAIR